MSGILWPGLASFLCGFALEVVRRQRPYSPPAWYSYNGAILPALPVTGYPYAMITGSEESAQSGTGYCHLRLMSAIPTVDTENGEIVAGDTAISYQLRKNYAGDRFLNHWAKHAGFSGAIEAGASRGDFTLESGVIWANFDVYDTDGTLIVAASEPLPATDFYTTLFEGDVTTVAEDYIVTNPSTGQEYAYTLNGAHAVIADGALFGDFGLIRITVDEVGAGYKIKNLSLGAYAGNYYLADGEAEDTGGDFGVLPFLLTGETLFLSREAGTYHVKVERIERRAQKEPVAYLYNGVRLPGLPDFEEPYAYMLEKTLWYTLVCFEELPTDDGSGLFSVSGIGYICYKDGYGDNGAEWHLQNDTITTVFYPEKWYWTNFDFADSENNVLFTKSEPVPVYE